MFPEMGSMLGYAATAVVSARRPTGPTVSRAELWDHVLSIPEPRILVIHDIDDPITGAFWGEVQSNIFSKLGCIGSITDGSVRDLDEVTKLGFYFFSKWVSVSHGYIHVVETGSPIQVGGIDVRPGDLLHGDKHGVTSVPLEAASQMRTAVEKVLERERKIINFCDSDEFSVERLRELTG
jgi:4-hydroxy-4-methyl-2-oxoglutarate aldolase